MANKAGSQAPFIIVFGGDAYLNKRTGRDLIRRALHDRPDAERIDLDATGCDQYAFDEAVSPSLLADVAVVVVDNLQNAEERRRVEPLAAQQLVAVLGERTGEMAAMCSQLCFDFDDDPITLDLVNRYLTSNPQVTGFSVADKAIAGRTAEAIIAMRSAVEQGTDPIALIGALAMKLRTIAKASAVKAGTITQAQAKTNPWVLKNAMRQLSGWTSAGLGQCIRMLAWADEQSKTNGGDPVYALERCIELISHKGRG